MGSFEGKVILITGAGSGIGRATAQKLSSLGATCAISDINQDGLQGTKTLIGEHHSADILDVGDPTACKNYIDAVADQHGHLDHIFNCAGVNPTSMPLEETTDAYFDKLCNANIKGIYNMTKHSIPYMKSGSSYVNVSSISGLHPSNGTAIYCATKYAVVGFSKSMALELGPKGVRVNIVAPGFIDTPSNGNVVAGPESVKRGEQKVAMGRFGTAEEVAEVVAFLMGDGASYMNGSVVEVNGGTG